MAAPELYVDIETFATLDLRKASVYAYVEDPAFEIMMAAYAFDDDPVEVAVDRDVEELLEWIRDPSIVKVAHNAGFERVCFSEIMLEDGFLPPEEWVDTMALAGEWGYPQSLDGLAKALGTEKKDSAGTALVNFFCKPTRGRGRNTAKTHPEKWALFVEYCRQDVVALRDVRRRMPDFPTAAERRAWEVDQHINDRGIRIDLDMARAAWRAAERNTVLHKAEFQQITGVENAKSQPQVLAWFRGQGLKINDLRAETITKRLEMHKGRADLSVKGQAVVRALELRQELALAASAKYTAALQGVSTDGRLRGQFRFFGAHTGRWSGRGVQLQNLPSRGTVELSEDEAAIRIADLKLTEEETPEMLKSLVRPMFLLDGVVVDYSAIEARVVAWIAGEEWALEAFRAGRDIYVETANRMGGLTRTEGKVAVLALGYNGGVNSLRAMAGGDLSKLTGEVSGTRKQRKFAEDEALWKLVRTWRETNPRIVGLWAQLGEALLDGGQAGRLFVEKVGNDRHLVLPSGRAITYRDVRWEVYTVVDPKTKRRVRKEGLRFSDPRLNGARAGTYGGRLTENATQAVARDVLGEALVRLHEAGFRTVGHVHDEILVEGPASYEAVKKVMVQPPGWADGLPIDGDGFECKRYRKG